MIFYSNENINKNYLCTYAKAVVLSDRTQLYNTLSGESVSLKCTREQGYELLNRLEAGMDDDEMVAFLKDRFLIDEEGIEYLYRNSIIE